MGQAGNAYFARCEDARTGDQWRGRLTRGALLVGLLVLAGCADRKEKLEPFEGFFFSAKAAAVDKKETLAVFTATVSDVSQSLKGARQAAEYEGIKYCIEQYGNSKIDWTVGPDTAPESLRVVDDKLTFSGRCDP
jgi:hypothetical protein